MLRRVSERASYTYLPSCGHEQPRRHLNEMHDLEAAQRPVAEQAEAHQAEEPRLGWSDEQGRWIPGSDSDGDPHRRPRTSSTSDASSSLVEEQLTSSSLSRKSRDPQEEAAPPGPGSRPARGISALSNEPIYVQFEDDDPENPFEWSRRRKWIITGIGALRADYQRSTRSSSFVLTHRLFSVPVHLLHVRRTTRWASIRQVHGSPRSLLSLVRASMPV